MPLILALDTTAELGSIALYDGGRDAMMESAVHSPEGFGQVLFDRIALLLERASRGIGEVDCFAAASGPGSFTGLRVGLTAVKGLAESTGKPVVAVSNLKALASFGTAPLRATVIDARRGEVYGALYDANLEAVQPERVLKFQAWVEGLSEAQMEFIGTNFAPFSGALAASRFRDARVVNASGTLAAAIARIAHREFLEGRASDPAAIDANYVRRSDAELSWRES